MIGSWTPLHDGRGSRLALSSQRTAAAELRRLTVWSAGSRIAHVEAPVPEPGRPRFAGEFVLWGDGKFDITSGEYKRMPEILRAIGEGSSAPPTPSPLGEYVPTTYAWGEDSEVLVVAAAWNGAPGPPPARAVLVNGSGHHQKALWEGSDVAPMAAWVGREVVVVGVRQPRVFDRDGCAVATLAEGVPAVRIEASADDTRLLVVEHGRLTVWDTASWKSLGTKRGAWLDATIDPIGRILVAADLQGRLQFTRVDRYLSVIADVTPPDPVRGVALGTDRLVAAFAAGAAVREAPLTMI